MGCVSDHMCKRSKSCTSILFCLWMSWVQAFIFHPSALLFLENIWVKRPISNCGSWSPRNSWGIKVHCCVDERSWLEFFPNFVVSWWASSGLEWSLSHREENVPLEPAECSQGCFLMVPLNLTKFCVTFPFLFRVPLYDSLAATWYPLIQCSCVAKF